MSSRPQGRRIPPFRVKLGKARQKNAPEHVKSASRPCFARRCAFVEGIVRELLAVRSTAFVKMHYSRRNS
jgi:hypothetical protein